MEEGQTEINIETIKKALIKDLENTTGCLDTFAVIHTYYNIFETQIEIEEDDRLNKNGNY